MTKDMNEARPLPAAADPTEPQRPTIRPAPRTGTRFLALVCMLLLLEMPKAGPAAAAARVHSKASTSGATQAKPPGHGDGSGRRHTGPRARRGKKSTHLTGMASFYGSEFAHRRTASGERFDPSQLTAAHRTLPFGTRVRVTNLENGRRVVVRINDRGPYARGRVLDLSRAAARKLGFVSDGVTRVRLEILRDHHGWRDPLAGS
jgi:rare lipoprotein A (peptidoglycan hydrolase)